MLGVYRNVEGIELQLRGLKPTIIPLDRAGVPFYDELVLVASSARLQLRPGVRRRRCSDSCAPSGSAPRAPAPIPGRSLAILRKVTGSDAGFLARATPATLALLAGTHGVGCMRAGRVAALRRVDARARVAEEAGAGRERDDDAVPAANLLTRPNHEQHAAFERDRAPATRRTRSTARASSRAASVSPRSG